MIREYQLSDAIYALVPNAKWAMRGQDYNQIEWFTSSIPMPSLSQLQQKVAEMNAGLAIEILRIERDKKLAESDWRMTVDYEGSDQEEWKTYRSELRNLPNRVQSGELTASYDENMQLVFSSWPTPPA